MSRSTGRVSASCRGEFSCRLSQRKINPCEKQLVDTPLTLVATVAEKTGEKIKIFSYERVA